MPIPLTLVSRTTDLVKLDMARTGVVDTVSLSCSKVATVAGDHSNMSFLMRFVKGKFIKP